MSTKSKLKEDYKFELQERSKEELEEEIRNQQTLDSFVEADKTGANQNLFLLDCYELKKITIFNT